MEPMLATEYLNGDRRVVQIPLDQIKLTAGIDCLFDDGLSSSQPVDRRVAQIPLDQIKPTAGIGCLLNDGLSSSHPISVIIKHSLDLILAVLLLILTFPVILVATLLIKLTSNGPVLYHQQRVGRGGKLFSILKLRTMVVDADRKTLTPSCDNRFIRKLDRDPRITSIGWFLRKSSIDELPQLINVLQGKMSIVGPRPLTQAEVELLPWPAWATRYRVQPGITGLWQVSGRNNTSDIERLHLDIDYVRKWNLLLDLYIMLRTIPAVFTGRGAR